MSKPLTIEDLRNPKRNSGFAHVHSGSAGPNGGGKTELWKARSRGDRVGPYRTTPEAAAQDYCNFANNGTTALPPTLKQATKQERPAVRKRVVSSRERELRKELREELEANPVLGVHEPVCYLISERSGMFVKIGHADYNVYSRLDSLQTGNPRELRLVATLPGGADTERKLHGKHFAANVLNEWFTPTREILAEFKLTRTSFRSKLNEKSTP